MTSIQNLCKEFSYGNSRTTRALGKIVALSDVANDPVVGFGSIGTVAISIQFDDYFANLSQELQTQLEEVRQSVLNLANSATFSGYLSTYSGEPIALKVTDRKGADSGELFGFGAIVIALDQQNAEYATKQSFGTTYPKYVNFTIQHIVAHEIIHKITNLEDNLTNPTGSPHNDAVNQVLSEISSEDNPPRSNDYYDIIANQECFPAGTPITLADSTTKLIEHITTADQILTHDANGTPVAGIVDKLFTNTTTAFIRLTFPDGRDELITTPGHRFLTETGDYMEIGHMVRLGGGAVLAYSAQIADMFPVTANKTMAFEGNAVLMMAA